MSLRDRARAERAALVRLIVLGLCGVVSFGCVERRYTIRTNPPGALVYVNGEEVGPTPVSRSFTYYGDREIVIMADGYQTQRVIQPMPAPWWDNGLTDFFTENLVPFTLRDDREYVYNLTPSTLPSTGELQQRAEQLRNQGQSAPAPRPRGLLDRLQGR